MKYLLIILLLLTFSCVRPDRAPVRSNEHRAKAVNTGVTTIINYSGRTSPYKIGDTVWVEQQTLSICSSCNWKSKEAEYFSLYVIIN